jgi:hypothetical protein
LGDVSILKRNFPSRSWSDCSSSPGIEDEDKNALAYLLTDQLERASQQFDLPPNFQTKVNKKSSSLRDASFILNDKLFKRILQARDEEHLTWKEIATFPDFQGVSHTVINPA